MNKREDYKDIELSGRKWRIKKFDAFTGSFMLIKVTSIISPLLKNIKPKDVKSEVINYTDMLSGLTNLSEEDFRYIQGKCLKVCSEMLPSGLTPVLNADDTTFGVIGLETDTSTVLGLTVQALVFNVTSFFDESLLASITEKIQAMKSQDAKM